MQLSINVQSPITESQYTTQRWKKAQFFGNDAISTNRSRKVVNRAKSRLKKPQIELLIRIKRAPRRTDGHVQGRKGKENGITGSQLKLNLHLEQHFKDHITIRNSLRYKLTQYYQNSAFTSFCSHPVNNLIQEQVVAPHINTLSTV